jgi:hypothetical protein
VFFLSITASSKRRNQTQTQVAEPAMSQSAAQLIVLGFDASIVQKIIETLEPQSVETCRLAAERMERFCLRRQANQLQRVSV